MILRDLPELLLLSSCRVCLQNQPGSVGKQLQPHVSPTFHFLLGLNLTLSSLCDGTEPLQGLWLLLGGSREENPLGAGGKGLIQHHSRGRAWQHQLLPEAFQLQPPASATSLPCRMRALPRALGAAGGGFPAGLPPGARGCSSLSESLCCSCSPGRAAHMMEVGNGLKRSLHCTNQLVLLIAGAQRKRLRPSSDGALPGAFPGPSPDSRASLEAEIATAPALQVCSSR